MMKINATHGMATEYTGKDGIERISEIFLLEDGSIYINLTTWWDGKNKEPLASGMRLTAEAYSELIGSANEFALNLGKYRLDDNPDLTSKQT